MSTTARRSLLTATAAGTLLGALWFVPSATATGTAPAPAPAAASAAPAPDGATPPGQPSTATTPETADAGLRLADTGSFDSTPYLFGGTAFLGVGAALVVLSVRRGRFVD